MMKCLICGRASLPGAKLCPDCSSARKRAFAATVTQPLLDAAGSGRHGRRLLRPSQSVAATARRTAERSLQAKPPADQPVVATSRRLDVVLLSAGCVVMLLIGLYVARQMHNARPQDAPPAAAQATPAGVDPSPSSVSVVPPALTPKPVGAIPTSTPTAAMPATESTPVPAKSEPVKRANSRLRSAPVEAATAPADPTPAPPLIAVSPPPVAAVPAVHEAPKADALQLMQERLAQCATGNIIDRILCDQRVRREYCAGRWGQVPECSSSVANDRGQ
jgi:hypothetical protein